MVRNPFSRIVSAYYDKMITTSPGHTHVFKHLSEKIIEEFRHIRLNVTERNQTDDGTATFEEFVNFLISIDVMDCDVHFISYISRCKPCHTEYDYVIKFETLKNDIEYLKQKLNISEYHRKAVFPRDNFKTSKDVVKETFNTIPKDLALKLYEKYRKDFEIFGYEKPEWLC